MEFKTPEKNLSEDNYANFYDLHKDKLNKISSILHYLNNYSNVIASIKIKNLLKPEELFTNQQEWVWLVSNYDGLEKEHFKPYWVPIETENYSFFIDMSDDKLPLLETTYFIYEPYSYFNTVIFTSIMDLMIAIDANADFAAISKNHFNNVMTNFRIKLAERNSLILEGKVPVDPVTFYEITDEEELEPLTEEFDGEYYTISCYNVNATVCGLLPYSLPLKLGVSGFDHAEIKLPPGIGLSIIKTVRELTHIIRLYRPYNLQYYEAFITEDMSDSILYEGSLFKLKTSHIEIKEAFVEAYNLLKEDPEIKI